ncbi:MAG: Cysteine desulfurase [Candidatus Omnitrophica bacterium]|nr:Cysteine desulfurase [Candidatus Omnitrophota bacterium]
MTAPERRTIESVRADFPMLAARMNGRPLAYLDNAATTQKPRAVIERMSRFLSSEYATVHRGIYTFSQESTRLCDEVREKCRAFLNAARPEEIVFVRGATEAINLVAHGYGRRALREGDEVLITELEHHSNIVPWQRLCQERGLRLRVAPVNDAGEVLLEEYRRLLGPRTYLVAVTQVSNALGTVTPLPEMIKMAHHAGAVVLVDGAQGAPHRATDVRALDCDFYCFSGHKIYGPTGIGVLYGKMKHLEAMDPYQSGGDMIESVSFEETTYAPPPAKFEAGTPAFVEIIGLGEALDYVSSLGWEWIGAQEEALLRLATERLSRIPGLRIIGQAPHKAAVVSFDLEGIHPHDVGTILNEEGIAVRAGNHCAQPVMRRYGLTATTRASFAYYNTAEEVEALVRGIERVRGVFA